MNSFGSAVFLYIAANAKVFAVFFLSVPISGPFGRDARG